MRTPYQFRQVAGTLPGVSSDALRVIQAPPGRAASSADRARLIRQTRIVAWVGIAWHVAEFGIAVVAGAVASSIALLGFGIDSAIEAAAGLVVVWLFASSRAGSASAERRAQQLIAASFFLLAAYLTIEGVRSLAGGSEPEASWVGIGLAAVTAATMPLLARVKRRLGRQLSCTRPSAKALRHALRLPLDRASRRVGCERRARLVVGRPRHGSRHRSRGGT